MNAILKGKKLGFTLVELMTAMAITAILVVVIIGLTGVGLNFLKDTRELVRASQQSRPILTTLAQDLESMQYRRGNAFEWLYAGKDTNLGKSGSMQLGPKGGAATNAAKLLFFTSAPDRTSPVDGNGKRLSNNKLDQLGDVNFVSYQLIYRDHILDEDASEYSAGFPVFALYRQVISASDTYNGSGSSALLGSSNLLTSSRSYEATQKYPENYLSENIVEFTVAFEVEYEKSNETASTGRSNKEIVMVPMLASKLGVSVGDCSEFRLTGNGLRLTGGPSQQGIENGRVCAVIVSVTVLTDEGVAFVDQLRKGRVKSIKAKDFFKKYSRSFTQRLPVVANS